ncbi:MAG: hypothetical protein PF795_00900 [Kiritimatiellae bacterium]|jgi:hypothetical protein|nr:hypothetical protein [Kiritimatiellia bacterium]
MPTPQWDYFYALYLDIEAPTRPLLSGLSSSPRQGTLNWVQSDSFPLRVYFRRRSAAVQTDSSGAVLADGLGLALGAREKSGNSIVGDPLFDAFEWTLVDEEGEEPYYETDLDLKTPPMADAIGDPAEALTVQVDIEVGTRLTFIIPVTILPEAYKENDEPSVILPGAGHALRTDALDWEAAGAVDVAIPDPMLVETIVLTSDVEPIDAEFSLGTPADPDAIAADQLAFEDGLVIYSVNQLITGGVLRFTLGSPSSDPAVGQIIAKGTRL